MLYLGNILTQESFPDPELLNVVKSEDKLVQGIPTLIVGWEKALELYPNASIIDWEIDENTYWTFGKRVRRDRNEKDIRNFRKILVDRVIESVKYRFFNVLTQEKEIKRQLMSVIRGDYLKYVLISGDMLYMYIPSENICIGISLEQIEYEGADKKVFLKNVFVNRSNILIKEKDYISSQTREFVRDRKYLIPYMAYLASD